MNIAEIPIASAAPHFVQENIIFGNTFFLEFEWIEKGFWMLHLSDGQERALASGIRLISDWPLYIYYESSPHIAFALLPQRRNDELNRQSLKQSFTLVAYESLWPCG